MEKVCKILFVKSTYINKLENIRMKFLSEEKLFTSYFILGSISDIFLKRYLKWGIKDKNKNKKEK